MWIFHSYVSFPEGNNPNNQIQHDFPFAQVVCGLLTSLSWIWTKQKSSKNSQLPPGSLTARPWKYTISSNHRFSGAMLNFGGVTPTKQLVCNYVVSEISPGSTNRPKTLCRAILVEHQRHLQTPTLSHATTNGSTVGPTYHGFISLENLQLNDWDSLYPEKLPDSCCLFLVGGRGEMRFSSYFDPILNMTSVIP